MTSVIALYLVLLLLATRAEMLQSKKFVLFFAFMLIMSAENVQKCLALSPCIAPKQSISSDVEEQNVAKCVCTHGIRGKTCKFQGKHILVFLDYSCQLRFSMVIYIGIFI